jgi:hypothetical protein
MSIARRKMKYTTDIQPDEAELRQICVHVPHLECTKAHNTGARLQLVAVAQYAVIQWTK